MGVFFLTGLTGLMGFELWTESEADCLALSMCSGETHGYLLCV